MTATQARSSHLCGKHSDFALAVTVIYETKTNPRQMGLNASGLFCETDIVFLSTIRVIRVLILVKNNQRRSLLNVVSYFCLEDSYINTN